jgi:hypothetical protein
LVTLTDNREGTEQSSLDALRKATATSYNKANGSLGVKLVSSGDVLGSQTAGASGGATLQPAGKLNPAAGWDLEVGDDGGTDDLGAEPDKQAYRFDVFSFPYELAWFLGSVPSPMSVCIRHRDSGP